MSRDRRITESRLHAALDRLLKNKPIKVKASGKLTPNKINNEAGLGNSYRAPRKTSLTAPVTL